MLEHSPDKIPVIVWERAELENGDLLLPLDRNLVDYVRTRRPDNEILDQFVEIDSPQAVVKFVKKYGSPYFRTPEDQMRRMEGQYREPLADWYRDVELFKAIRDTAACLDGKTLPTEDVQRTLFGKWAYDLYQSPPKKIITVPFLRNEIAQRISMFMTSARLRPVMLWNRGVNSWSVCIATMPYSFSTSSVIDAAAPSKKRISSAHADTMAMSDNCLGALTWQLINEVTNSTAVACFLCGKEYRPKRAPTPGRPNYCDECRANGRMWRYLKQRKKEEGTTNAKKTRAK